MKKYIYRFLNIVNNKVYVGQTNNLKRRLKEHRFDKRKNKLIKKAIDKYGIENFHLKILYYGENYNEEEKKWIKYYNSNNRKYGYNIVSGGQDSSGEDNPMSKITNLQVDQIIELLLTTNLYYKDIAKQLNVSESAVAHINIGETWRREGLNYPLRKKYLNENEVKEIYSILKNTNTNFTEIGNIFKVERSVIQLLNLGKTYKTDNEEYPIRRRYSKEDTVKTIKTLLKTTNLYYKDIASETNTSISIVSRINLGKSWYDKDEEYPLRSE